MFRSVLVVEDDLLVHRHAVVLGDFRAEFVESLDGGILMGSRLVSLPVLLAEVATVAHVVSEELGQVLGKTICLGPLVLSRVPRGLLVLFFVSFFLSVLGIAAFGAVFLGGFLLDFFNDDILDHVSCDIESGRFLGELEANDTDDLADVLLNVEEFVHKSKLKALLFRLKFV